MHEIGGRGWGRRDVREQVERGERGAEGGGVFYPGSCLFYPIEFLVYVHSWLHELVSEIRITMETNTERDRQREGDRDRDDQREGNIHLVIFGGVIVSMSSLPYKKGSCKYLQHAQLFFAAAAAFPT